MCVEVHDGEAEERIGGGEMERRRAIVPNRRDSLEGIGDNRSVGWLETSKGTLKFISGSQKVVVHII